MNPTEKNKLEKDKFISTIMKSLDTPDPLVEQTEMMLKTPYAKEKYGEKRLEESFPTSAPVDYVSYDTVAENPELYNKVSDYMEARLGSIGKKQEDESPIDYIKRAESHARFVSVNTINPLSPSTGGYGELLWTVTANDADKLKAAEFYDLFNELEPFYKGGPGNVAKGIIDYGKGIVLDPFTYVGFGTAKLAVGTTKKAAEKAVFDFAKKQAYAKDARYKLGTNMPKLRAELDKAEKLKYDLVSKAQRRSLFGGAIGEGAVAPVSVSLEARLYNERNSARDLEMKLEARDYVFPTLVNMFLGGAGSRVTIGPTTVAEKTAISKLDKILKSKEVITTGADRELIDSIEESTDQISKLFDPVNGSRESIEELSPATVLTHPSIKTKFAEVSANIAKVLIASSPGKYTIPEGGKVTDLVNNILMGIDDIDDDLLEQAVTKSGTSAKDLIIQLDSKLQEAGLSMVDFAKASRQTTSDAASNMATLSRVSRLLNRVSKLDPDVEQALKVLSGDVNDPSKAGKLLDAFQSGERNMKVLLTTAFSTTVRNVIGTGINLTTNTASDLFENFMFYLGTTASKIAKGDILDATKNLGPGLKDVIGDSFRVWIKLAQASKTSAEVDKLLEFNPRFLDALNQATQESGNKELFKIVRFANGINMAQDAFFRKAIFMASVQNQLKKIRVDAKGKIVAKGGQPLDVYDIMANNKSIPPKVFQRAMDDAMKVTMSYRLRATKDTKGLSIEKRTETIASKVISATESVPFHSAVIPFPNFMANALRTQYRLSPFGSASGVVDIAESFKYRKTDPIKFEATMRKGLNNFSKGVVGTSMLMYFVQHAEEFPEIEAGKLLLQDGSTYDLQGVFPLNVMSQLGRFIVDFGNMDKDTPSFVESDTNVQELIENIIGIQRVGGSTGYFLEQLGVALEGSDDRTVDALAVGLGKVIEGITGRAIQPTKTIFDYAQTFYPESTQSRDPNIINPFDSKYTLNPEDIPPKATPEKMLPETKEDLIRIRKMFMADFNISMDVALDRLINKIPGAKEKLPLAKQYLREGPPVKFALFETMLGGRLEPRKNKLETLFNTLRIEAYKQFPRTKFPMYDRAVVIASLPYIQQSIEDLQTKVIREDGSNYFDSLTPNQKREEVKLATKEAIEITKEVLRDEFGQINKKYIDFIDYNLLSGKDRRAINRMYKKDNEKGLSIDQTKEYGAYVRYLPYLPSKGGFFKQEEK